MKDHHRMRVWDGSQYWYANIPFEGPWLRSELGKKRHLEEFQESSDIEEWELCTGLSDKNGVPIYEGDILQVHEGPVLKVEFIEGCFDFEENESDLILWENCPSFVEIIGNIHQNPEL